VTVTDRPLTQDDLSAMLGCFWHPVCTTAELGATTTGVLGVRLLGRDLAVARTGGTGSPADPGTPTDPGTPSAYTALVDRCPHRSTRLSVGWVDGGAIRCAYHGWRWGADGRCVEIPSAPDTPIPARFCQQAFSVEERHGMIWVRLDDRFATAIPAMPGADDPTMRVVAGTPYTWPTAAARRVENFVDLAHFAWVHDGTLGRRDEPVPPSPTLARVGGELRFHFEPPSIDGADDTALVGVSDYRLPIPLTVDIDFAIAGLAGVRRHLWMTASPIDPGVCRSFWTVARNDGHDEPDEPHLEFQRVVLAEDEPVVCNQDPPELPLDAGAELHVRADRVSVEYRRWLVELTRAVADGGERFAAVLGTATGGTAPERPEASGPEPTGVGAPPGAVGARHAGRS
jgi:phenylpropionate dioxygenase-like ring-hydroxylating dioxygenase large terminal subunit